MASARGGRGPGIFPVCRWRPADVNRKVTPLLLVDRLEIDQRSLEGFPEPAAVILGDGRLVAANPRFSSDAGLLDGGGRALSAAVLACLDGVIVQRRRTRCGARDKDGDSIFELIALPLAGDPPRWLLLAKEVTVEVSLRDALVESRARYMDIVALSGESAWETAEDGRFTIITPSGMAGYQPRQLIGQDPGSLLDPTRAPPTILPFSTPLALKAAHLWLRHADGHSICFEVSAVPLYDANGVWRGARGICRDVTEERQNRSFLAELRNNERLLARINEVFRKKSIPDDMLLAAAEASIQGLEASGCQILVATPAKFETDLALVVSAGSCGESSISGPLLAAMTKDAQPAVRVEARQGWSRLMAPTIYSGQLIGALLVWRSSAQPVWTRQELQLVGTLAGQLATAIDQRADYHRLLDASRTDLLTGLYNRRAFDDELTRRFQRLNRGSRMAALLFVDLDNFKFVNDLRGHAVGDEVLRHVADILRCNTRSSDLVARIGGDEFAVWLEDVSEQDAVKRARIFLAAGEALSGYSGDAKKPLQMSIGIAPHDAEGVETIAALMKRADAAMYQIKRSGKASVAVAPPPEVG